MQRLIWICALALVGTLGCDSDDSPGNDDAGPMGADASAGGGVGGGPAGGAGGMGGTGGGNDSDAGDDDSGVEPETDGGASGGAGGGSGGLATDGTRLAVCYSDADCTDPLECSRYGANAGFCVEACTGNDKDCSDIEGIETTCGSDNKCRVDCGAAGSDGKCPTGMECAEIVVGLPPLGSTSHRCQYPAGSGAKDTAAYGECDATRGAADCKADLDCQPETGMCVATCESEADCSDPGTDATPLCDKLSLLSTLGTCALSCADDKDCPGNLLCQSPGLLGLGGVLTGKRCAAP